MANKYYVCKHHYTSNKNCVEQYWGDNKNYVVQYWTGDGFSTYEAAAKKYENINMAYDIANMLNSIATIQDEQSVKYAVYAINDDVTIGCKEVNND